jgi:hypothetical protein
LFGAEAVLPEEIKHQSLHTTVEVPPCPSEVEEMDLLELERIKVVENLQKYQDEVEEKDLLELERIKVVENLQKYQDETRSWRDPNVKKRDFDVGNLVLLRSPRTENSSKLESKWEGSYVIIEKTRPRVYRLADPQGPKLEHSWNSDNIRHFYI